MNSLIRLGCIALALFGCALQETQAGVVLSLSPSSQDVNLPSAGGTNSFSIEARIAADSGTQQVKGYSLPVDLGPPAGIGVPTGWKIVSVTPLFEIVTGVPPTVEFDDPPNHTAPAEGDLRVRDQTFSAAVINLTTSPLALFRFTVEINDQAIAGNYTASYTNGPLFTLIDQTFNPIPESSIQRNSASITLQAVPEPNAMAALGFLGGLGIFQRRRRS